VYAKNKKKGEDERVFIYDEDEIDILLFAIYALTIHLNECIVYKF